MNGQICRVVLKGYWHLWNDLIMTLLVGHTVFLIISTYPCLRLYQRTVQFLQKSFYLLKSSLFFYETGAIFCKFCDWWYHSDGQSLMNYYCFGDVAFLFCMIFAGLVCLHEYLKIKKKTIFKPIWASFNQFEQVLTNLYKFDPIWTSKIYFWQVWNNFGEFVPLRIHYG